MWNNKAEENSYCSEHLNRKKGDKVETLDNWIKRNKGLIEKY